MTTPMNGDAFTGGSFGLQIDKTQLGYLQKVDGLGFELEAITTKSNSSQGRSVTKQQPGGISMKEVTFVRASDGNDALSKWIKEAEDGNTTMIRSNVSFFQCDTMGNPHRFYNLKNAWIKSWSISSLEAGSSTTVTETVTIVHEGLTVTGT